MDLDNLKPAWRQLKVLSAMQRIDKREILLVLERAEDMAMHKSTRMLQHAVMFVVLTFSFQGG